MMLENQLCFNTLSNPCPRSGYNSRHGNYSVNFITIVYHQHKWIDMQLYCCSNKLRHRRCLYASEIYARYKWLVACSAPNNYPSQGWLFVNWTVGYKFQWNLHQNTMFFNEENAFQNVVCNMLAILSRSHRFEKTLAVGLHLIKLSPDSSHWPWTKMADII